MLAAYVPILILFGIAVFIAVFVITVSAMLGPQRGTPRKLAPYESGMEPIGAAIRRIPVKFYVVAMLFIIFDIEVIFFYPYALVFRELGVPGLIAMGVFFMVLVVGFVYEWKKGALKWE
ncbi:NADH-quinone oxidoreductase subunit A [Candidatus Viridilinea mediisalina]|uniref:NADH-quinone oxidoreductase subunit A n=1 Tax=Candidatus Viridilinea mediisalina TaxID=2024553 RepID=A0A2A6RIL3_9CHLR|nr:NADH-quinone oxidoreductase subunit A [Candidatus Viridilinea mediisalina]PDW02708.1 NADH-quinone oxidoreductase subunit A [Candidatus Viridilinea mediisalina]